MWTRKEIKQRAKEALKRNYWKIVLVSLLTMVLGGGISYSSGAFGSNGVNSVGVVDTPSEDTSDGDGTEAADESATDEFDIPDQAEIYLDNTTNTIIEATEDMNETVAAVYIITIMIIVCIIVLIGMIIAGAVSAFLYNPFRVGVNRFMLKSVDDTGEVKEMAYAFDHSYINVVKTMFHVDLRVFLWALLFVIPGIYKKYQYRMVSYILAEHPELNYKEVLQMSIDMMNGEKWHAFVLDLSFILWHMLGMITCGIVEIFYVNPYVELTDAALYRKLCELRDGTGQVALPDSNYTYGREV
ncbi:MAG: DUF975 family protein [Lachnospiraceae bacterium]|nr:DUF975 family protein [Lachnospiraceae bacterium]